MQSLAPRRSPDRTNGVECELGAPELRGGSGRHGAGDWIPLKRIVFILVILGSLFAYYHFVYQPAHQTEHDVAFVLAETVPMVNTPADIRQTVETLRAGEQLAVLSRTRSWAHVQTASGADGWVELKNLLDGADFEAGKRLFDSLEGESAQAAGHVTEGANLRLEPSREGAQLALLPANQSVGVFGRRMVDRPLLPDQPAPAAPVRDAWYLVKAGSRAGWILGRLVTLDMPEGISSYTQGVNVVAWFVLNTIADGGRQMPQYLVVDRLPASKYDFDHLRVFTWWSKNQKYVTAYVESNLRGYFPIRVQPLQGVPHFRLRVVDDEGNKVQRVYGLFDTRTRLLGLVPGWDADVVPTAQRPTRRAQRARPARRR